MMEESGRSQKRQEETIIITKGNGMSNNIPEITRRGKESQASQDPRKVIL